MRRRLLCAALLVAFASIAPSAGAAGRHVVFVDAARPGGDGTRERPFGTIREASAFSSIGTVIYVAEAAVPYEENVSLQRGQMLVGSAFGLDAVKSELHIELDAPPLPAARGTGPVIHGWIALAGENVVAGCSVIADRRNGVALTANSPQGPITIRELYVRTSENALGLYLADAAHAFLWSGGALEASDGGSGIAIAGGNGAVTFDHVRVEGSFATALSVRGRSGGTVVFGNGSPLVVRDASRDGVVVDASRGSVRFDSPLRIRTSGGRGLTARDVGLLAVTGAPSSIETTNATAVNISGAAVDMVLERVSAVGVSAGQLPEGVVLDKVHGKFAITGQEERPASGGTIRDALSYGLRITQSSGVTIRNMAVEGGGIVPSKEECPADVAAGTNLHCRAAVFLRHVADSSFENISIDGNGGVGVNANNVSGLRFSGVRVTGTGDRATEPALSMDEVRGEVSFSRCAFFDASGGAVRIAQQFNDGRVTFERCEIGAAGRPGPTPALVQVMARNTGKIDVAFSYGRMHDNAGEGITVDATGRSSARLALDSMNLMNIDGAVVRVSVGETARAALTAVRNRIAGTTPAVTFDSGGSGCLALEANEFQSAGGPAVRIAARSPNAHLAVVGGTTAEFLSSRNGGAPVVIEGRVEAATDCR